MDPCIECFVLLAWHSGHRAARFGGSAADVDLESGSVVWRAESDEIGYERRNPLHAEAVSVLKRERARRPALGDAWIFPAPRDATTPRSGDAMQNVWKRLATASKLPAGERYGWHSLRRAFANRLRRAPLRYLQDLGGWKTSATLLTIYVRADERAQREALEKYDNGVKIASNQ